MFTHLRYRPYDGGTPQLISGKTLLFLLERSCRETVNRSVNGSGTGAADNPWRLTQPGHWLTCANVLTTDHQGDAYLTLGGRMIKKNARVYVSDEGPSIGTSSTHTGQK